MEKILVTGFEPFGGERTNPSWEVASTLPATIAGHAVVCERIPVSFSRGPAAVLAAIKRENPAIVLCLGQAGGRAKVTPEFVGINYADARIPDNDGVRPRGTRLLEGAPDAHFSTLPVHAMAQAMADAGVPAAVSYTAGTYVCNAVLFSTLHARAKSRSTVRAGFVHVPYAPEQARRLPEATPSMPTALMLRGIVSALECACSRD
jgi:pyroglutamyl-peptidase